MESEILVTLDNYKNLIGKKVFLVSLEKKTEEENKKCEMEHSKGKNFERNFPEGNLDLD